MTQVETEQDAGPGGTNHRAAIRLAWSLCVLSLLVMAGALLLIVLGWSTPLPRGQTPWRDQAVALVGIVGAPVVGGLIAARQPRNPYGWLWLGFGLGLALQALGESYASYALVAGPGSLVAPGIASRLLDLGGPVALTTAPFLFLLFPTGRLPSPRWRPLAWIAGVSGAVVFSLNLLFARPELVGGTITAVTIVSVAVVFVTVVLSALSLVVRYLGARGVERQQLEWFALAAVLVACYLIGFLLGIESLLNDTILNLLDAATNMGIYAAVGIAILRYRLYDIDVLINRTLVYGSLTVTLLALYFGSIALLQALFRALAGEQSTLAIVASTLAIAALFNPLRYRIQSLIDRRFYRRKYDARATLESFSAKLRDETDLDDLSDGLVEVIRETVQPAHASLWLRPESSRSREPATPAPAPPAGRSWPRG